MAKVLIIENDDLNLKLFHDLLIIQKCEILVSKDGVDVLETAINEKPDLILMDIQLNGISGIDLTKELKKNLETKDIPIIVITAFAMKSDELTILQSGCDMYIPKPISIHHFFDAINKFIKPPIDPV